MDHKLNPYKAGAGHSPPHLAGREDEVAKFLEYLALPVLHVIAAAFNFTMVLLTAKPVFSLPFKSLKEVMETRETLTTLQLQPKKVIS
jgi:hypothetical protein